VVGVSGFLVDNEVLLDDLLVAEVFYAVLLREAAALYGGLRVFQTLTESLILAQDERWRRA
jgi:hypothetical protein